MNNEFEDLIQELNVEAEVYKQKLNMVSEKIKRAESALKELDLNTAFAVEVKDGEFVIHWADMGRDPHFRLYLTVNNVVDGAEVRPFMEHKKEIRIEASQYIEEFLRKFIENIRKQKI